MANDTDLLKEVQERFNYCVEEYREIREEATLDMKFISGDPWDARERKLRKDTERPILCLDELNQYVNQRINDVRQNKRAIKVDPGDSDGTDDTTAELHSKLIRTIEYNSRAQSAYITAYENALQRSYGYFRIGTRYVSDDSFDQELVIRRIPNPDTVYLDPDCKEADCSDARYGFVIEDHSREEFKQKWPGAEIKDFSPELMTLHPRWIKEERVQVAEYWRIEEKRRRIYLVGDQSNPQRFFDDELKAQGIVIQNGSLVLPQGAAFPILRDRAVFKKSIAQYITNGVEVLERNPWLGKWIPIIPVWGKEIYVDLGAGAKRMLFSLIRLARDPQKLYCYYKSAEAEVIGQAPKTPFVGYEGQFEGHEQTWTDVNKIPIPYLQVKPVLDATGQMVLPLPQRQLYEPPVQALELGAESAKRSIQNAMGMYNASVGRQDTAAKSGRAIRELDLQSDQGNFHFIDNYDRALEHAGRILDDMIPKVYDTARTVAIRNPDETQEQVKINQPSMDPKTGQPRILKVGQGSHSVTISTGPSYQSQREEASEFANAIAQKPEIFALIGDLVVKSKHLGPLGDEMADRLTPPQFRKDKQNDPQAVMQKLQQADQMIQALTEQLNKASDELSSKRAELESKEKIEALKAEVELAKVNAQLASKENIEMMRAEMDRIRQSIEALRAVESGPEAPGSSVTQ